MNRGLKGLEERVLKKGLCTACGACLSLCPYLRSWKGRVVKLHDCGLDEGRCFSYCPKVENDLERSAPEEAGQRYEKIEMGPVRRVLMVRAKDLIWREKSQSGGVVSSLIDFALRKKLIDAAILTQRETDFLPKGRVVRSREDILACAGSSYVSGPTLEALHKGPWQEKEKIGVVGLPCQALALRRMKSSSFERKTSVDRVGFVIGLFCTWALEYERFILFLQERVGQSKISKMEITPPPKRLLQVYTNGQLHSIPVDEIRPFIRKGCQVCLDMTAEFSDISVGTVEGVGGWNTVILRSAQGEVLFKEAEREGMIECQSLPEDHLNHLKEASLLKRRRGMDVLREIGRAEGDRG